MQRTGKGRRNSMCKNAVARKGLVHLLNRKRREWLEQSFVNFKL